MNQEMLLLFEALKDVKNPFTLVGIAVIVGAVVRLLKTKTVGDWFAATPDWLPLNRIPKKNLPDVALFFGGLITFLDGWLNGHLSVGTSLLYAVVGAVLGGGGASIGHQVVAKRLAANEDPLPPKGPSVKDPDEALKGDGSLKKHPYREPAIADAKRPPKLPPIIAAGPIVIHERKPAVVPAPPPMKPVLERRGFFQPAWLAFGALSMIVLSACGIFSPKTVLDVVLKASDVACLMTGDGSKTDDPDAAAIACKLAQDPTIREIAKNLVGQRVAAKRAGFVWKPVAVGSDGLPANDNGDGGIVEVIGTVVVAKDGGK